MKSRKFFAILFTLIFIFTFTLSSKEKGKIPKILKESLKKAEMGEVVKNGFFVKPFSVYFFPAQGGSTQVIFSFKYNLVDDGIEKDKKISEKKRDIAVIEIMGEKNRKKPLRLFYPLEGELYRTNKPIFFEFQVKKGTYTVVFGVASSDLKRIGANRKIVDIPTMNPKKLDTSSIIFIKNLKQITESNQGFSLYNGEFPMGMYMAVPYEEYNFSFRETPQLLFFILGAKLHKLSRKYKISIGYSIVDDSGKTVVKFKPQTIESTVVVQPIPLVMKNKPLSGNYTLKIEIIDLATRTKVRKEVEFSVR